MLNPTMDAIDEIQSKKRREAGLNAWAEMLERIQSRPPLQHTPAVEEAGGGAGLPRDTVMRQNTKISDERKIKLQEIQANVARLQAEAQKLQDKVEVKQTESKPEAPKPQAPAPAPTPAAAPAAHAKHLAPTQAAAEVVVPEQTRSAQEEQAAAAQAQAPVDTHEVEKVTQLVSQAGLAQPNAAEQVEEAEQGGTTDIEEALRLMALKNDSNPALAAKDYVLASQLPGVSDTLNGGVFEDFRVAL